MRTLKRDLKHGIIRVMPERIEDDYALSLIIKRGDIVEGLATRKIKLGGKEEPVKKRYRLRIRVEKTSLENGTLRVNGRVEEGVEEVPSKSFQSIIVSPGSTITIIKEEWSAYALHLLKQAGKSQEAPILLVVHDREEASFALLRGKRYTLLETIRGNPPKKDYAQNSEDFYREIAKETERYSAKYSPKRIIVASPAFFKEYVVKLLADDEKVITASCSTAGERGVNEVLKRDELRRAVKEVRQGDDSVLMDELKMSIAAGGNVTYGIDEVERAVNAGAVSKLLISQGLLTAEDEAHFRRIDALIKKAESSRGELHIFEKGSDAERELNGLGGIAAFLRYRLK